MCLRWQRRHMCVAHLRFEAHACAYLCPYATVAELPGGCNTLAALRAACSELMRTCTASMRRRQQRHNGLYRVKRGSLGHCMHGMGAPESPLPNR